jgi:hypothetical protein
MERCLACEAEGVATQSVGRVQYGRFTDCRAYSVCRCGALRGTRFPGQTRTEPRNDRPPLINHLPPMPYPSASQARQRSMGSDRAGLAGEAALHGFRPSRPRKRGSAPRVPTESASQARQRSTGSDRVGLASEAALHGCRGFSPMTGFFLVSEKNCATSRFFSGNRTLWSAAFPFDGLAHHS